MNTNAVKRSSAETAFLVLMVIALAGGLSAFLPGGQTLDRPQTDVTSIVESGDFAKQVMLGLLYVINLALLVRIIRPWAWWFIGFPLIALTILCFVSTAWSVIPDGTVRRDIALSGTLVFGLYAGLRCDERRITSILAIAAAVSVVGAAAWTIAYRRWSFDTDGFLRGTFFHKDAFGAYLGLSLTSVIYRMLVLHDRFIRRIPLLCGLGVCLVLAGSSTSIVAIAIACLSLILVMMLQHSRGLLQAIGPIAISLAVVIGILLGPQLFGMVAEAIGRDPTFSGRLPIWEFVIPMIGKRPWLGYGYGIFWLGSGAPANLFWYWSKQYELHAHNGYLELLLDVGFVGFVLSVWRCWSPVRSASRGLARPRSRNGLPLFSGIF
jgi:exopolysaccharide production protein ExoQ